MKQTIKGGSETTAYIWMHWLNKIEYLPKCKLVGSCDSTNTMSYSRTKVLVALMQFY